jgi:hypothetical protein
MSYRATLDFTILEARDLPRPSPKAHQTPYCLLELPGHAPLETSRFKDSVNPKWRELFHVEALELPAASLHYALTVSATIHGQSREIARVEIDQPLAPPEPDARVDAWIPLAAAGAPAGEVHVQIAVLALEEIPGAAVTAEEEEEAAPPAAADEPRSLSRGPQKRPPSRADQRPQSAASPRSKDQRILERVRLQIENDEGDAQHLEREARATAEAKYEQWLRQIPPAARLLDNAAKVAAFRKQFREPGTAP